MFRTMRSMTMILGAMVVMFGCATAPEHTADREALITRANETINNFKRADATLANQMSDAAGYAVFPTVGKGGAIVGGAFGRGIVYQDGKRIGYCAIKQGTVGAQLGGQSYSELILFENERALNRFRSGEFAMAAQASAVAAASGAAANADYKNGVMVFTMGEEGLMAEASIGGQKFTYEPMMAEEK